MDIVVHKNDLTRVLARAAGVVEKASMQLLSMAYLDAAGDVLTVRATDLMIGAETSARAKVKEPGTICVPAKRAYDIVKSLPSGDVRMRVLKTHVEVSAGKSKLKLDCIPSDEYPTLPALPAGYAMVTVARADLSRCITQGSYAMLTDDSKPDQHGGQFELDGKSIRVVSAQSKYCAWADGDADGESPTMMIPFRSVGKVQSLCEGTKEEFVRIALFGSVAFFIAGNEILSCKTAEAKFPPYRKIVPESSQVTVMLPRQETLDAVKRAIVAIDRAPGGAVLTFGEGTLTVSTEKPGECEDTIDCDSLEELAITIDPKALQDVLQAVRDDSVKFGLNGPKGVIFVQTEECKALLMPMLGRS